MKTKHHDHPQEEDRQYICPMHPDVVQDVPGMCPHCGMNLVPVDNNKSVPKHHKSHGSVKHDVHGGVDKHAGHHTADFLKKFWVVLALTIPILGYSEIVEIALGRTLPQFPGVEYVILLLGSLIFFYGGWVFLVGAYHEIRARLPGMMTLIGIATTAAYLWSVYATFVGEHTLFWELATLIAVMLLGHWVEMKSVEGAKGALKELAKLVPDTAEVVRSGKTVTIPLSELQEGDVFLVKPGGKVPADGVVQQGESEVNESIITGESRPVSKKEGDEVIAGSINGDGSLTVVVTKIGENTFISGVMRLVSEAENSKSRLQLLSDKAALYLTGIAITAGGVTFVSWIFAEAGFVFATERLVAVLVITCPHALGLAVPLVASISTDLAAKNGFLVKKRLALEAARGVDTVLFDKTGTLTEGKFSVTSVSSDETLSLAAAVETKSEHPIGVAILEEARARGLSIKEAKNFRRLPGVGAEAVVDGILVFVGHRGESNIVVEANGIHVGTITVSDKARPEAKKAIEKLTAMGLSVGMITGDSEEVAQSVAQELGIKTYFARVRPEEKSEKVKLLQREGKKVAFVGDGVNDAPALATADLGIAIGAGTTVAIESAGIILVRNDPRDIPKIITLSRATYSKMMQNLFWATGYNVVALPLAAGALFTYGIILQPAVAAVFMSLSTVIVAFNAVLLRRKTL